jgi:hypothetical protein
MSLEIISYCSVCLTQTKHHTKNKTVHGNTSIFMVCDSCHSIANVGFAINKQTNFNNLPDK